MHINDVEPNGPVMWNGVQCIVVGLNIWRTRVVIRTPRENEFLRGTVAAESLSEGWSPRPKASPPPPPPAKAEIYTEDYTAASKRLLEKALFSGDGETLRDIKTLMDHVTLLRGAR